MIGTTFRLGFDGTAVDRGLRGVGSLMGRFTRQVAIGGARQIGARATDLLGRLAFALPDAIRGLADWGSGLSDISAQTRVASKDLMLLNEQLRLAGASPADIGRTLSTFGRALHQAATVEGSAAGESLRALGFSLQEFQGMGLEESFMKIGRRVAELGPGFEGIEDVMGNLFGGMRGAKFLSFFNDLDANVEKAKENLRSWGNVSEETFAELDAMSDALGRWEMAKNRVVLGLLKGVGGGSLGGFTGWLESLFSGVSNTGPALEKLGANIKEVIEWALASISENGIMGFLGDALKSMGQLIAEGFFAALSSAGEMLNGVITQIIGPGGLGEMIANGFIEGILGSKEALKAMLTEIIGFGGGGGEGGGRVQNPIVTATKIAWSLWNSKGKTSMNDAGVDQLERINSQQLDVLRQIERNRGTATFA